MKKRPTLTYELGYEPMLFQTPFNPLKTKAFHYYPSLTTPSHRNFVEVVRYGCGVCCGWGWWCVVCGVWCVGWWCVCGVGVKRKRKRKRSGFVWKRRGLVVDSEKGLAEDIGYSFEFLKTKKGGLLME